MVGIPEPGWYADPADPSRHRYWDGAQWTGKTRLADPSLPSGGATGSKGRLWVGIGVGILVLGGIGRLLTLDSGDDPSPTDTPNAEVSVPAPVSSTYPIEVEVPEGWALYTSETGVMSYAVDPSWLDLLTPLDQDYLHEWYSDTPEATSEYSGAWLLTSSATGGEGVVLYIMSYSDGTVPGLARVLARGYINVDVYEDFEIVLDEEYTNKRGYPGWRIDYSGEYLGALYSESVIALKTGTTVVYVYGTSDDGFEALLPHMLAVTDSIVVHHPPAEG